MREFLFSVFIFGKKHKALAEKGRREKRQSEFW